MYLLDTLASLLKVEPNGMIDDWNLWHLGSQNKVIIFYTSYI